MSDRYADHLEVETLEQNDSSTKRMIFLALPTICAILGFTYAHVIEYKVRNVTYIARYSKLASFIQVGFRVVLQFLCMCTNYFFRLVCGLDTYCLLCCDWTCAWCSVLVRECSLDFRRKQKWHALVRGH